MELSPELFNKSVTNKEFSEVKFDFGEIRKEINRKLDIAIGLLEEIAETRKRLRDTIRNQHRRKWQILVRNRTDKNPDPGAGECLI